VTIPAAVFIPLLAIRLATAIADAKIDKDTHPSRERK
jgi:hypothetical protein